MSAVVPAAAAPLSPAASWHRLQWIGLAVLLIAACALPFLVSNYRTFQFTLVLVYAIALLGLNILTGYNGQISLGHGAFYAIGAYVAAILMDRFGMPYWATVPVAGAVCLVVGFLFGLPALRLEGHYLALATFALGVTMPQLLKNKAVEHWTGGVQGIVIVKPDAPFGLKLSPGPVALPVHARDHRRHVRHRLEPDPRAGRPGARGDPRPSDRRLGDGHRHGALQVARLRRQRHVHRHRRLARGDRDPVRRAGQLRVGLSIGLLTGIVIGGWHRSRARSSARSSSSSSPTSPTRSRRRRPGRSTVSS
jgi:hypothetical protein